MGLLERLGFKPRATPEISTPKTPANMVVGASGDVDITSVQTFNNTNITYQGNLQGFNYDSILRDKQGKIAELYKLSDYYVDEDPVVKGVVKHVYVPFSMMAKWKLVGVDDKVRNKYLEYYRRIRLNKKLLSIFLQYYKYANVFIYLMPDLSVITLPIDRCKITNVTLNGEPLVEFNLDGLKDAFSGDASAKQKFFKDTDIKKALAGYPEEVAQALTKGETSVQLNPENTFVLQDIKEDWQRYAVPMIASFLPHLAKKALIRQYEDAILNLGLRSFVHVKYGDPNPDSDFLPDINQLRQVRRMFSDAMSGQPLAVTNTWAQSEIIQADTSFLYEWDKYKEVNEALLSAGGISGVIVNGVSSDGSTFSSAQVSMKAAAARIEQMLASMAELLSAINRRVYQEVAGKKTGNAPVFTFMPLSMDGRSEMQKAGLELWKAGALSSRSMLENYGYDIEEEFNIRKNEDSKGITETLLPRESSESSEDGGASGEETRGRKTLDNNERNSDEESAMRSKMPKPSSPEGSMDNLEGE